MEPAIDRFPTEGRPVASESLGGGHINRTYLISTDAGAKYVLQRVNPRVFPQIGAIMENLRLIQRYLLQRGDGLPMIRYLDTLDGRSWFEDGEGACWRLYRYVDGLSLLRPERPEDLRQSALAFGRFLYALRDFPADELTETIPRFHDTPDRYRQLREAAADDPLARRAELAAELDFAFSREMAACRLQSLRERGELPVRVTHNDTKLSNALLDKRTRKALCVIDLDTVMPGLSACDFGDAIRSGAATGAEDGEGIGLDLGLYRAFARGFLEACPHLTARERESLPLGAYTMTVECGVRFLTDYLNGDRYFAVSRPRQNLDRARAQFALAADMERKREQMQAICAGEYKFT